MVTMKKYQYYGVLRPDKITPENKNIRLNWRNRTWLTS
jgi:hypothetical protein